MDIYEQQRQLREQNRKQISEAIQAQKAGAEVVKRLSQIRFGTGGQELVSLLNLRIDRWQVMLLNVEPDDVGAVATAQTYIKAYGDIYNMLTQEIDESEPQTN